MLLYIVIQPFAQIHQTDDMLLGKPAGIRREIGAGIRSLHRFMNPTGLLVLLYIFIAVPLCGIGFSIGLTESFQIPHFIMDVIWASPLFTIAYILFVVFLIWIGFRSWFTLHAVLIDGMTPKEGQKRSVQIIREHGRQFLGKLVKLLAVLALIVLAARMLFVALPSLYLDHLGADMPADCCINLLESTDPLGLTEEENAVIGYRVLCSFTVMMGAYLYAVTLLLCEAYFMLRFTRFYFEYTGRGQTEWPERPRKSHYYSKVLLVIGVSVLVAIASLVVGLGYNQFFDREEPVRIIAHRAGGTMASENSLEGLQAAIDQGCYASETDVQRTADGYYVINHDGTFKRVAGVARAPKDMTLEEIRQLRIQDTTGSGELLPVVTLEEMLDTIKGKELLYIELKGATADQQMVDDVVRIVREHDCVEDVALISLDYKVIDYAESTYPEFQTGTLFFLGIGNVSRLNCDLLIMEEETATSDRIKDIHDAGKEAVVWTVNTEESMRHFLDSKIDAIITDEVLLAEQVQEELDARTDLRVLQDKLDLV